jgi:iron-sulfur cluster assembly protein
MVQVTESAAKQILRLKTETPNVADGFLRVKITPGGCSGMSYKLDFDNQVGADDKVFEQHGTRVVIDKKSFLYVVGMTLDFEGGLNGKGFVFSNPNASKTCGCGSSFGV